MIVYGLYEYLKDHILIYWRMYRDGGAVANNEKHKEEDDDG